MKRFLPILFLLPIAPGCMPDEPDAATQTGGDTSETETVDTFSVKRPQPLTVAQQAALDSGRSETREVTTEASSIITEGSPAATDAIATPSGIVAHPDVAPSFPGGQDAMNAWFRKKLVYPLVAFQNEIKGTVQLRVVIENDGKIGGIVVMKGLGYGCDEAATDCVRTMPNWIPARKNGVNVRTAVTIPVTFGNPAEE